MTVWWFWVGEKVVTVIGGGEAIAGAVVGAELGGGGLEEVGFWSREKQTGSGRSKNKLNPDTRQLLRLIVR